MITVSPGAGVLANTTLIVALIKQLAAKGLFDDQDLNAMLQSAVKDLQGHEDGAEAVKLIAALADGRAQ